MAVTVMMMVMMMVVVVVGLLSTGGETLTPGRLSTVAAVLNALIV